MRYRKPPVEVEAVQWTGENREEVAALIGFPMAKLSVGVQVSDWVVRHPDGAISSCRKSVFEATYEPVGQGERAYTREQLLSREFIDGFQRAEAEMFGGCPDPSETETFVEAALDALDKGKGGEDG